MKTIPVVSSLYYLTQVEGVTWRDQDYRARNMVKIVKGEPIKGYLEAGPSTNRRRFTAANQNEFMPLLVGAIAPIYAKHLPAAAVLVPIPNSDATASSEATFRTQTLAEQLASSMAQGTQVIPALRWKEPRVPSHKGGSRNPHVHLENLVVMEVPKAPIVLFDDVITTGSQLVAAYRALTAAGGDVKKALVYGRAVKDQKPKMIDVAVESLEVEEAPLDWA